MREKPAVIDILKYETELKTGVIFFLFLSYLRGFIYVGTSYLNTLLPPETIAMFGIVPLLFLLIPNRIEKIWNNAMEIATLIWVVSVILPFLQIKTVTILLGTGFVYGGLRYILTTQDYEKPVYAVMLTVTLDLIFQSPSRGTDAIISGSLIQVIFALGLLFIVFLLSNPETHQAEETKSDIYTICAIIAIFLLGFTYMLLFANPGVLTLLFNIDSRFSLLFWGLGTMVILGLLDILFNSDQVYSRFVVVPMLITAVVSINYYPWFDSIAIGLLGYLSVLGISALLFRQIVDETHPGSLTYSAIFTLTIVIILIIGLQIVLNDNILWYYILILMISITSFIGLLPLIQEGVE